MKIACVINSLSSGGAERIMSILAGAWSAEHEVSLILFEQAFSFYRVDPRVKITSLGVSFRGKSPWGKVQELKKLYQGLRLELSAPGLDVVISFMDQANVFTLLSRPTKLPVIVSERVAPGRSSLADKGAITGRILLSLRNLIYRTAHAVVVQTSGAQRYFVERGIPNVHIAPNPVVPPPPTDSTERRLPSPCIISMGRLVRQKRFDLLIQAFSSLAAAHPEWHLVIVGEGPLRADLAAQAERAGLSSRVHFPGTSSSPHAILQQAQIFALSSDYEGFPGALCEAMSVGLAAVATDCPFGPSEIIRDGTDGLLVPPGNATALAAALERLIKNAELRTSLGTNARAVVARFSLERVLKIWAGVFP